MVTFTTEEITERIIRIKDGTDVCMYLLVGSERALLIDTGYGIGDLRGYVESLLGGKPYDVVCTHGHVDHAAGASSFGTVYMSDADLELYAEHGTLEFRRKMLAEHAPEVFAQLEDEDYAQMRTEPFLNLVDGQLFELGDLTVEMVHVPGHAQGMFVPIAREERVAFFGDACGVFTLLILPEASTVAEYRDSLLHLREHAGDFDRVLRQHGTCESPKSILDGNIGLCEDVLSGAADAMPHEFMGIEALLARAVDPATNARLDGGEGNLVYRTDRIR